MVSICRRDAHPYRGATAADFLEAPVREGTLRLEVGPRAAVLVLGDRRVSISEELVTLTDTGGRKPRHESLRLGGGRLVVARSVPHEELGLWFERAPGVMRRLFGVQPLAWLDDGAFPAWHALDALSRRLRVAVRHHAADVVRAIELGRGADRVLVLEHGDRHVLYQRLLFREHARRSLEVHADGTIVLPRRPGPPGRDAARRVICRSRYGLTVLGDYLRFAAPSGLDLARAALPWIGPEDRAELARRFGELVECGASQH